MFKESEKKSQEFLACLLECTQRAIVLPSSIGFGGVGSIIISQIFKFLH